MSCWKGAWRVWEGQPWMPRVCYTTCVYIIGLHLCWPAIINLTESWLLESWLFPAETCTVTFSIRPQTCLILYSLCELLYYYILWLIFMWSPAVFPKWRSHSWHYFLEQNSSSKYKPQNIYQIKIKCIVCNTNNNKLIFNPGLSNILMQTQLVFLTDRTLTCSCIWKSGVLCDIGCNTHDHWFGRYENHTWKLQIWPKHKNNYSLIFIKCLHFMTFANSHFDNRFLFKTFIPCMWLAMINLNLLPIMNETSTSLWRHH